MNLLGTGKDSKGATGGSADAASHGEARHETPMIELTDELLVAFVDGELSAETHASVQAQIAKDPVAQSKVKDMRETAALLRAAFQEDEPKDNVIPLKPPDPRGGFKSAPLLSSLAVAAAVALMIGAGLFMDPFGTDERAEFMADMASYHSVYAQETEHLAEVPASRKDHIEEWLGARLNRELSIPDLSAEGWAFEGGRLLAEGDQPIAQLLYTSPGRQPIAICITQSDHPASKPTQYEPGKGIRVAAWDAGGYLYMVVGALEKTEMDLLTEQVRRQFGIV